MVELAEPARLSVAYWTSMLSGAAISARQRYRLSTVKLDAPLLVVPLAGSKHVLYGGQSFRAEAGDYLMIHRALEASVENVPAADGPYVAGVLDFPWRLVELARRIILDGDASAQGRFEQAGVSCNAIPSALLSALRHYLELAQAQANAAQLDHALVGILIALHVDGSSGFLFAEDPSLSARIRLMVGAQPRQEWSSADFEGSFHMSGATLRRRLAEERASLRTLIREARLQHALVLLQTTRKPLAKVAEESGYRSMSGFREGFLEQFGVEPGAVAND